MDFGMSLAWSLLWYFCEALVASGKYLLWVFGWWISRHFQNHPESMEHRCFVQDMFRWKFHSLQISFAESRLIHFKKQYIPHQVHYKINRKAARKKNRVSRVPIHSTHHSTHHFTQVFSGCRMTPQSFVVLYAWHSQGVRCWTYATTVCWIQRQIQTGRNG